MQPAEIVDFWTDAGPARWFAKSLDFDQEIRARFEATHHAAARGELEGWAQTAPGALALIVLLDQTPRNIYRGSAHAFATDPLARRIACGALEAGQDRQGAPGLRPFFYLPFEHSEDIADQKRSVALFRKAARETGDEDSLKWALAHLDVIERFGHFPHRNLALGRETSEAERAFLDGGGFAG